MKHVKGGGFTRLMEFESHSKTCPYFAQNHIETSNKHQEKKYKIKAYLEHIYGHYCP